MHIILHVELMARSLLSTFTKIWTRQIIIYLPTIGKESNKGMHPTASMHLLLLQLLLLCSISSASSSKNQEIDTLATEVFDCKHVKAKDFVFDLSGLPAPVTITDTESTPPTETTTSITIKLCESLEREPVAEPDQCPPGTRVCLKISNKKNGEERLTQVIGAGGAEKGELIWNTELGKQLDGSERALELELHGSLYAQQTQKTEIKFLCDAKAATDNKPTLKSYDKKDGELKLEWITPHACAKSFGGGNGDGGKNDSKNGNTPAQSSGGWGFFSWFFFLIFLGGLVYFGLGFWRNYNEYGVIELPNKDFWREAPYIAKDMGKHIYSTVSGQGTSRGSYEPV